MAEFSLAPKIASMVFYERPYEKLLAQGSQSLSDSELLAILLQSGTKEKSSLAIAQNLLGSQHSLDCLGELSPEELQDFQGIGPVKALRLRAAFELAKRLNRQPIMQGIRLDNPEKVFQLLKAEMSYSENELCKVLLLNCKNALIRVLDLAEGNLNSVQIYPRDLCKAALRANAAGVILVHCHPSGDPTPSEADLEITKKLASLFASLDIKLQDHIIFARDKFLSLRREGYYSI